MSRTNIVIDRVCARLVLPR